MKRKHVITLVLTLLTALCSFSSYAASREQIKNVDVTVTHYVDELTAEDVFIQINSPNCSCISREYMPITNHIMFTLKSMDGYYFSFSNASDVTVSGAKYVHAKKQEQSSILRLYVDLGDGVTWREDRGNWKADENGVKYLDFDGTFAPEGWKEINGKHYYFDENGYVLINTRTPDGYKINSEGEWDGKSSQISPGVPAKDEEVE